MKWKLLACLVCLIFVTGCSSGLNVERSEHQLQIEGKVFRYDSVILQLPESNFSKRLDFELGPDFVDLADPIFWEKAREKLIDWNERVQSSEDYTDTFEQGVPSIEWLEENTVPLTIMYYIAEVYLPSGGVLFDVTSEEIYKEIRGNKLPSYHLVLEGKDIYLQNWSIDEEETGVYFLTSSWDYIGGYRDGEWVYRFPDEFTYLIIDPTEVFQTIPFFEELDIEPFEFEILAPMLTEK